jgi:hypothetical protein
MKLQCSCGAKYAFDITPEMLQNPVKFVCPSCGLDSSDFVNQLVREELAPQAGNQPLPDAPPPPLAAAPPPAARIRISSAQKPAEATPAAPPPAASAVSQFCSKHLREPATEKCAVCGKPICPKCMELFGYFCSPLCKGKAEAQNLDVPVYAGRKDLVEAKFWRKTGLLAGAIGAIVVLFFGAWTWYAWFGSVPHKYFSVRFEDNDRGYYGRAQLVGKDQLVYLHGGTLARCDLKTKKSLWSLELITQPQIADAIKAANEEDARMNEGSGLKSHRSQNDIENSAKQMLQAELSLRVAGQNIWVSHADKLTHYDWDSGKTLREITLPERGGELVENGDELLMLGAQSVTHISLASGDSRVEQLGGPGAATMIASAPSAATGGLPGVGVDNGQPLDPAKVEAQAQNLKTPARIALPALLANAQHERQLEAALKDDAQHPRPKKSGALAAALESFQLVPGQTGFVQFSARLLESHLVTRSALKAPTGKSALDSGNVSVMNETAAVNETLNEMQRNNGGGTVTEDESRYQVTVHLPDAGGAADWTGEVVGPPQLFVLKSANVIAAGKTVIVLDKANKKLWQSALTYPVPAGGGGFFREAAQFGEGPCVEHGDTLYVFDQAVLTAFELNSGNARWRLPSVGVVGLFFDDQGNVYVNTTTGNPDDIKYSRQIDINRKTEAVLFKVDPKTGKTLWSCKPDGYVSYLSGKFIYVLDSYDPNPTDEDVLNDMTASLQKSAFLRIARINPKDGRMMWEYFDRERCPVYARFDNNSIELIFKREVQVLRYLTF